MRQSLFRHVRLFLAVGAFIALLAGTLAAAAPAKPSVAVLPFLGTGPDAKYLATQMRFAVCKKLWRNGQVKRISRHTVNQMIDALGVSWTYPVSAADLQTVVKGIGADETVYGTLANRNLTLTLFKGTAKAKTVTGAIPSDTYSPRLAVEKLLTELMNVQFHHVREWQIDKSPVLAARFAKRPNLVRDPDFALAKETGGIGKYWQVFLELQKYNPQLITAAAAAGAPKNKAYIVPQAFVTPHAQGYCLMEKIGLGVAQNNGLAVESLWIPVKDGHRYRFTCQYYSKGPRVRIFLKGFSYWPDSFSNDKVLASQRRELYRFQLKGRNANNKWSNTGADFTPTTLKGVKHKIQWLRIDFYVYLNKGEAFFRDVKLKDISP